jgi:hypothetical protein
LQRLNQHSAGVLLMDQIAGIKISTFYSNLDGSKLIFFTPFRVGVNEENQIAD